MRVIGWILVIFAIIWVIGDIVNYSTCEEGHMVKRHTAKPSDYFVCDRRRP